MTTKIVGSAVGSKQKIKMTTNDRMTINDAKQMTTYVAKQMTIYY